MFIIEKNRIDKDECLKFCMEGRLYGHYKYFFEVMLHADDYELYMSYLKKCEKSKQEFIFTYIDTNEEYKLLGGFANFELKGMKKTAATDFYSADKDYDHIVTDYFSNWQERCACYIISDTMKQYKNTRFDDIVNEN